MGRYHERGTWSVQFPARLGLCTHCLVADKEIDGIERAENMENEEKVDAKTWQAELVKERDALEEEEDIEELDQEEAHGDQNWGRSKEAPY